MRSLKTTLLLVAACVLSACATSHMVTGTPRPPIDPAQVRFYYDPPAGFQEIAVLETSSGAFTYGNQNKTNSVMNKLRVEAAKLGANGVLYRGSAQGPGGSGVSVGAGGGRFGGSGFSSAGVGVNISPQQKYAQGVAIYVPNPPPEGAPPPPPPPPVP